MPKENFLNIFRKPGELLGTYFSRTLEKIQEGQAPYKWNLKECVVTQDFCTVLYDTIVL